MAVAGLNYINTICFQINWLALYCWEVLVRVCLCGANHVANTLLIYQSILIWNQQPICSEFWYLFVVIWSDTSLWNMGSLCFQFLRYHFFYFHMFCQNYMSACYTCSFLFQVFERTIYWKTKNSVGYLNSQGFGYRLEFQVLAGLDWFGFSNSFTRLIYNVSWSYLNLINLLSYLS